MWYRPLTIKHVLVCVDLAVTVRGTLAAMIDCSFWSWPISELIKKKYEWSERGWKLKILQSEHFQCVEYSNQGHVKVANFTSNSHQVSNLSSFTYNYPVARRATILIEEKTNNCYQNVCSNFFVTSKVI